MDLGQIDQGHCGMTRETCGDERGFTLIELMYSMMLMAILGAIALQSLARYRENAFDAHAVQLLRDVKVALQAGQSDLENGQDFFWAWTDGAGAIQGWRVDEFLPGVVTTADTRVDASYDGFCQALAPVWCPGGGLCCAVEWATARHCDGELAHQYIRWSDGTMTTASFQNWGC
ncbi:MAG: type II secretion system protein [Bdellovibrionales bacterium]|nr:type II secretion system protein [Bdellovibrionales bacterium]